VKARAIEELDPGGPLPPNIARIVSVRLDELRGFAGAALAPDAGEAQHDMRIAAKRLRYLLEIFASCLGEEADEARRAATRLQSVLGELHDCDLMLTKVEQIGSVAALLHERRERLFHEFVELWQSEARQNTWVRLEAVI
jgi:CHAD domain-containing protein